MQKFYDLLSSSVILQGFITFSLIATLCYLTVAGKAVPEYLQQLCFLVTGYFFGAKQMQASQMLARGAK